MSAEDKKVFERIGRLVVTFGQIERLFYEVICHHANIKFDVATALIGGDVRLSTVKDLLKRLAENRVIQPEHTEDLLSLAAQALTINRLRVALCHFSEPAIRGRKDERGTKLFVYASNSRLRFMQGREIELEITAAHIEEALHDLQVLRGCLHSHLQPELGPPPQPVEWRYKGTQ